jgi:hypothetical protein
MLDNILTKASFTQTIERLVHQHRMTYMEAILQVCEDRQIDPLDIGKLVSPSIKSKVETEAQGRNLLPKSNSLSTFL